MNLLFSCCNACLKDKVSLKVREKELTRGSIVAIFCRKNHWHSLLLDELLCELIPVVSSVIHKAYGCLSPVGLILVQSIAKLVQQKSFGVSISIDLTQRKED